MTRAFLSLGSNLGDRAASLRAALEALDRWPRVELRGVSKVYETVPVEVEVEQPDYLNCVAEVECGVPVIELLRFCQGVEAALGREGKGERGPRTVDVDVLLFGEGVLDTEDLVLPHPGILRAFNLTGLADLDPGVYIPNRGRVGDLLASANLDGVKTFSERT
jgi:2-amino-4-hydroxy-6-hydroxymethyldihydropteridine diphosphokinase